MDLYNEFWNVVIDSLKHLKCELSDTMEINYDINKDGDRLFLEFYQLLYKLFIPQGKYQVVFSKELIKKMGDFNDDTNTAVNDIQERLEDGRDIFGYFSRLVADPTFPDMLLRNWNLFHAHVKAPIQPNQKIAKRSKHLLFFTYRGNKVYFIDILPHPKGETWGKAARSLLEIVHNNWEELLNIDPNITGVRPEPTDSEIYQKMKKGTWSYVRVHNSFVGPANEGVSSSGDSNMAVKELDMFLKNIKYWQTWIDENTTTFKEMVKNHTGKEIDPHDFRLVDFDDKNLWIYSERYEVCTSLPIQRLNS